MAEVVWPDILERVIRGEALDDDAEPIMAAVLGGEATPAQIAGLLIGLRSKGVTVGELAGFVRALLGACEAVDLGTIDAIDTCGTGGSAQRREAAFHVSTAAALVVAGAGGHVCKHGNRKASATSGSADLLEALGVVIDLGPAGVARCVKEAGVGFCLAPRFHPGMRHPGPVRRELGVRTAFNLAAPLANPAGVGRQIVGVADAAMAETVAQVLAVNGATRAWVVYGHDGLDELTTAARSTVIEVNDGEVRSFDIDPASLGLALMESAPAGGDTAVNVALVRRVLAGEPGPHRDIVVLNAGAALVVAGVTDDLAGGLDAARAALDDGRAAAVLDRLVTVSQLAQEDEG